jgi:prepilin-type processing-associated H-X9-DG protein/prepilin-type N-terminal cleavage/methylation domain-containing protein
MHTRTRRTSACFRPATDGWTRGFARRGHAGFSLIELLFVCAIVAVLYTIMLGPSSESRQKHNKAVCAKNLQQLSAVLSIYAADHNGAYPALPDARTSEAPLSLLVPQYCSDTSLFICPGSGDRALPGAQPFADRRISYAYYMGLTTAATGGQPLLSDAQVDTQAKSAAQPLFSATGRNPGANHRERGGNVLFCDGHVEELPPLAPRELTCPPGVKLLNPNR